MNTTDELVKAQRDELLALLEDFVENVSEPPDGNCSCHISPPCSDCVDHSYLRELFTNARSAIAKAKGGV